MFEGSITKLMDKMMDAFVDYYANRMMQEPYRDNPLSFFTVMQKLKPTTIFEACMRAESGKPISRPVGTTQITSPWEKVLLSPVYMSEFPTPEDVTIHTDVVIGPRSDKPLHLEIPIMIGGMSFGGALSKPAKLALTRAARLAGTASNTGEMALLDEERAEARYLIGQFNRTGLMIRDDQLRQLDAIEIQLGQGAQASVPITNHADKIGEDLRSAAHLKPGEDIKIHSRLPGVNCKKDIISLVRTFRAQYGVPVGIKIGATHHLEKELEVAVEAGIDFFVVDGGEAGALNGPATLQDDTGLPTLFALARTVQYLERRGVKKDISVIASGGLATPGQFLKALALGADAVCIASIAILAMLQTQMLKAVPGETPGQLALYQGKLIDEFDPQEGTDNLFKFLKSCVEEMQLTALTLGKTDLKQLKRSDLVTVDDKLSEVLQIDYAGFPPEAQTWRRNRIRIESEELIYP